MLGNQSLCLLFRSDLPPTLQPERPSQDPKAPVLQEQTPSLHYVACFIHILSSLVLLLFCSQVGFTLNKVCWEFVSNALQREVICARVCRHIWKCICLHLCVCIPQKCCKTDRERERAKQSKGHSQHCGMNWVLWNLISKGQIWSAPQMWTQSCKTMRKKRKWREKRRKSRRRRI